MVIIRICSVYRRLPADGSQEDRPSLTRAMRHRYARTAVLPKADIRSVSVQTAELGRQASLTL